MHTHSKALNDGVLHSRIIPADTTHLSYVYFVTVHKRYRQPFVPKQTAPISYMQTHSATNHNMCTQERKQNYSDPIQAYLSHKSLPAAQKSISHYKTARMSL